MTFFLKLYKGNGDCESLKEYYGLLERYAVGTAKGL